MTQNDSNNSSNANNFLWFSGGVALATIILSTLVAIFIIYATDPILNFQPLTATPVPYADFDRVGKEITSNNSAEKLCSSHYPVDSNTRDISAHWEVQGDYFIVSVELYPDVDLKNGSVQFTKSAELVKKKEVSSNGLVNFVTVTDQTEYNNLVQQALKITSGNRGFMAYWIFQIYNGKPLAKPTISGCQTIPFQK